MTKAFGHWPEVSADIEPLEYTPKPECAAREPEAVPWAGAIPRRLRMESNVHLGPGFLLMGKIL